MKTLRTALAVAWVLAFMVVVWIIAFMLLASSLAHGQAPAGPGGAASRTTKP